MNHTYIIDGYNLIHALGMIQRNLGPGGLETSRRALLAFLVGSFGEDASRVTIVFDAKAAPPGRARQQGYQGLHIHFAPKGQSADDWIETLIANDKEPAALVVISNDNRLQNAAKQHKAQAWSDQDLLEYLEKRRVPQKPVESVEDRGGPLSADQLQSWLKEFESLEHDPALKEFFDYNRFD
jgi:predicted RNA-binding protein with PIN domain